MKWYFILLIVIVVILIILLTVTYFLFNMVCKRSKTELDITDIAQIDKTPYGKFKDLILPFATWAKSQKKEIIEITSRDGYKLHGEYLNASSDRTVIFFHGYRSTPYNDFAGTSKAYFEKGYNCLYVTQRSHGLSEGKYITYGYYERYDVIDWVNKVNKVYAPKHIIIHGMSMGCASVEFASSLGLPSNVVSLICDCGYNNIYEEICHECRKLYRMPTFPLVNLIYLYTKIFARFNMKELNTTDALQNNIIPAFFIHGKEDMVVPFECGVKNYEACSSYKENCFVDNANHAQSILFETKRVMDTIFAFIDTSIKDKTNE